MKFLKTGIRGLRIFGLYPLKESTHPILKSLYFYYQRFIIISLGLYLISNLLGLYFAETFNIIAHGFHVLTFAVYFGAFYSAVYFQRREKALVALVENMHSKFKEISDDGIYVETNKKTVKYSNWFVLYWSVQVIGSAVLMAVWSWFSQHERTLPLPGWVPYDWKVSPNYELTLALHLYWNTTMGAVFPLTDSFLVALATQTVSQFRILECDIRNLLYTSLLEHGWSKGRVAEISKNYNSNKVHNEDDQRLLTLMKDEKFVKIMEARFKKCIKYHQMLLEYCEDIEEFYSPVLFGKVASSFFFLIFITFVIVTVQENSFIWIFGLANYLYESFMEEAQFTVSGNMLATELDNLCTSLYETPWYICNKKLKWGILFMQIRCRRPIRLTAGKILRLNLETLMLIVKTAVSYFTVLRKTV